jgi:hypothetical protein
LAPRWCLHQGTAFSKRHVAQGGRKRNASALRQRCSPVTKTRRAPSDDELLRRGPAAQLNRIPGGAGDALAKRKRIVVDNVQIAPGQIATVEHDREDGGLVVAGIAIDLNDVEAGDRARFVEFTSRMFEALNGMLLDMLAATARKDYDDRRRRQAQGQAEGKYKGRPEDADRNDGIGRMIAAGQSWSSIQAATGCSRATIAKIAKRAKHAA